MRRAAPWIASLLAHALLVLLVPLSFETGAAREPAVERRVVLELDDGYRQPSEPALGAVPGMDATQMPLPSRLALPDAPALDAVSAAVPAAMVRTAPALVGAPSNSEILQTLPIVSSSVNAAASAAAAGPTVRVEWSGTPRTLSREVRPRFPAILSTTGQEAEVVARITVSPLGAVIDVEITRGSGYIEIDAAVERALRQCLYTRIEGKQNQIGTVYYRFPLEKRD